MRIQSQRTKRTSKKTLGRAAMSRASRVLIAPAIQHRPESRFGDSSCVIRRFRCRLHTPHERPPFEIQPTRNVWFIFRQSRDPRLEQMDQPVGETLAAGKF